MPLRVVTHRDTLLIAEADELGAVDVDHMLVDVTLLETPAVEPVHDLLVALHLERLKKRQKVLCEAMPLFQPNIWRMT